MISATFMQYTGEKRSFPRTFNATNRVNINGVFRSECDILNPVLYIDKAAVQSMPVSIEWYNYVNILQFLRGYFIENMSIDPNGIYIVKLHVDVLGTYSSKILNSKAFVNRNQYTYNSHIVDNKLELIPDDEYTIITPSSSTSPMKRFNYRSPEVKRIDVIVGLGSESTEVSPNNSNIISGGGSSGTT